MQLRCYQVVHVHPGCCVFYTPRKELLSKYHLLGFIWILTYKCVPSKHYKCIGRHCKLAIFFILHATTKDSFWMGLCFRIKFNWLFGGVYRNILSTGGVSHYQHISRWVNPKYLYTLYLMISYNVIYGFVLLCVVVVISSLSVNEWSQFIQIISGLLHKHCGK